ncbi:chemotaxis protein CheX [Sphingomonas gellani]|uniref:Chemotaxis protein CheX n=1 Tax=Sphingomonas gellani TaxID=1166340 RepID=A0A1H8DT37_9SPHN|nr:STAS domain-containing protein [Sphingomonas gellani]SEN09697.1 chemotaxis protein CheX [Sphingomonas gellani]
MPHLLAPVLDTVAAEPLRQALLAYTEAGEAVLMDGSAVDRAGLACLQVMASARESAAASGLAFDIRSSSEGLTAMVVLAGMESLLAPLEANGTARRIAA